MSKMWHRVNFQVVNSLVEFEIFFFFDWSTPLFTHFAGGKNSHLLKMKCRQLHPGFKLDLSCPFPYYNNQYIIHNLAFIYNYNSKKNRKYKIYSNSIHKNSNFV